MMVLMARAQCTLASMSTKNRRRLFVDLDFDASVDGTLLLLFRDGVSRCGVYCVVSMTWDKLSSERQADVFQAVHSIKRNRPQLICDKVSTGCCRCGNVLTSPQEQQRRRRRRRRRQLIGLVIVRSWRFHN